MKLVEQIMTNNPCYKAGRKITVKGIMLHSVGVAQPKATAFINSWNKTTYTRACVHGFIDANDGTAYQTLPWNHRGWHCGSGSKGSANNTHIGVEMCEPAQIKYTSGQKFTISDKEKAQAAAIKTYNAAVELFAYLCKKYSLDPTADGVIISHKEGNKRGVASNHGDPEHLWNGLGLSYTMDTFRAAVKQAMTTTTSTTTSSNTPTTSGTGSSTSGSFQVKVTIKDLYIRKGPGTTYAKNGHIAPGVYTITQTQTAGGLEWGKLASGAGWIALKYAEKLTTAAKSTAAGSFKVKVTIKNLYIRAGAGTGYTQKGYITPGVYTITQTATANGLEWGKLASGAGWIALKHTERL